MAVEVAEVVDVNLVAVLVAAVTAWVLGAVWYAKPVFGGQWQKMVTAWTGLKEKQMRENAMRSMFGAFFIQLVMAYVLAYFVGLVEADTFVEGVAIGGWAALGFTVTTSMFNVLMMGQRRKLWAIDAGYNLATLLLMGGILGVWR